MLKEIIPNEKCSHCGTGTLMFTGYSKMFVFVIFPFPIGKDMQIECLDCQRTYLKPMMYELGTQAQYKALAMEKSVKHPKFVYIMMAFLALMMLVAILSDKK